MNIFFLSFRQARQKNKKPFCFHRHLIQLAYFLHPELCELTTIISEERYIWDKCFVNSMMKNKYVFLSVGFRYIRLFMLKKKMFVISYFLCGCFYDKVIWAISKDNDMRWWKRSESTWYQNCLHEIKKFCL